MLNSVVSYCPVTAKRMAVRAAFWIVTQAWKMRPNSMIPNMSSSKMGKVSANSTIVCPRRGLVRDWL